MPLSERDLMDSLAQGGKGKGLHQQLNIIVDQSATHACLQADLLIPCILLLVVQNQPMYIPDHTHLYVEVDQASHKFLAVKSQMIQMMAAHASGAITSLPWS